MNTRNTTIHFIQMTSVQKTLKIAGMYAITTWAELTSLRLVSGVKAGARSHHMNIITRRMIGSHMKDWTRRRIIAGTQMGECGNHGVSLKTRMCRGNSVIFNFATVCMIL